MSEPLAPRAIDHLVVPTRDLAALADAYRRLGFTVGRRNRHPWGTENHVVQFDGSFFELLGFAGDYAPIAANDPAAPFAGFLEAFMTEGQTGIAMAVLRSVDAQADARDFQRGCIGSGRVLPFSRETQGVDGSDRTVSFTIAFAEAARMPRVGFFTCEQHRPENFWTPSAQAHANGAVSISGFIIVAAEPSDCGAFLEVFAKPASVRPVFGGLKYDLDGGEIQVLSPAGFALWSSTSDTLEPGEPHIVAALVATRSLERCRTHFDANGIAWQERDGALVVGSIPGVDRHLIFHEG